MSTAWLVVSMSLLAAVLLRHPALPSRPGQMGQPLTTIVAMAAALPLPCSGFSSSRCHLRRPCPKGHLLINNARPCKKFFFFLKKEFDLFLKSRNSWHVVLSYLNLKGYGSLLHRGIVTQSGELRVSFGDSDSSSAAAHASRPSVAPASPLPPAGRSWASSAGSATLRRPCRTRL